ncbi:MAG: phosphoribosyltransferase [Candidatus Nomurabacteria bacterium]|nr:MAG: phosphoribosyltransferase [Candidatus Nomurabacteria bacterium]
MIERARILEQMIINEPGVMDGEDVHHELAGGGHGRKLALKEIPQESDTYRYLIETEAQTISELYDPLPDVIIGMANSANRIARDTVGVLEADVELIDTEKNRFGHVVPTYAGRVLLRRLGPEFALVIEDVGTTGRTVAKFIEKLEIKYSIPRIEALFTWQRQPELTVLDRRGIAHNSIINTELKTYRSEKECKNDPDGYCYNNIQLLKRKAKHKRNEEPK